MSTLLKTAEVLHADEKISAYGKARSTVKVTPLSSDELRNVGGKKA
jgi:hypothetical protein